MLSSSNEKEPIPIGKFYKLVQSQREFFLSGQSANLDYRIKQLKKLRKVILEQDDALAEAIYKDLRRKKDSTKLLELTSLIPEIDYMINNIKTWSKPQNVEKTLLTLLDTPQLIKQPKGLVLIIGPWNYPIWTIFGPLIGAIAAGNTIIIKPSEIATYSSQIIYDVITQTFNSNYIAVVQGAVSVTTELLNEKFDHIVFTGSTEVGQIVMKAAAKYLSTITLELGGKSPTIVLPDANLKITARRIAWGKWINCGQTCIAPDYIITTPSVKSKLVNEIVLSITEFYGNNIQKNEDYSRIINANHFNRLKKLLDQSNSEILFKNENLDANDLYIPPIILDVTADDVFMKKEIFGPILPILTVQNIDEAIKYIQDRDCPLALYLFTQNEKIIEKVLNSTRSGGICINDVILHAAADCLPFGGVGKSGMGRYKGKHGFDEFSHEKPILKRGFFADSLTSSRYPPITKKKVNQLSGMASRRYILPHFVKKILKVMPYVLIGTIIGFLSDRFLLFGCLTPNHLFCFNRKPALSL